MKAVLALLAAVALVVTWQDEVLIEKNVPARMRDGIILRADVYRRAQPGRLPALLQRTPYSKNDAGGSRRFRELAARGYVVIVQDTRGRYTSDGVARPHDEADDGFDTIAWAASLPSVNGKVGMFGGSYLATTQLLAATTQPPALTALFPSSSYASRYDMVFQGGAFYLSDGLTWNLDQAEDVRRRRLSPSIDRDGPISLTADDRRTLREHWLWHVPLKTIAARELRTYAPGYFQMLAHPSYDEYWDTFNIEAKHSRFLVPAFHITGWYDTLLTGTLRNFAGLRGNAGSESARRGQRLIVGPWTHSRPTIGSTRIADVDFGEAAGFDSQSAMARWFDGWLKSTPEPRANEAPVKIFVMGENRWRDEQEWPLARARETSFYLHSKGGANTRDGDGTLSTTSPAEEPGDQYTYDPRDPVPTGAAGGYSRSPSDQREAERRRDVLVYTSEPLTRDLEVTGPIALELWISSSVPDTDFTAKLVDVFPDGTARALTDGILRARYREDPRTPRLLTPGTPTKLRIDVGATSNLFRAGHRIRLDISSSNFPRFDRNPNTGGVFGEDADLRRADQTIFHDAPRASRLLLPVVPREQPTAETQFMAGVSTEQISTIHRLATRRPHVAGTPASLELADRLREALNQAGLQTETHDYRVHLSTPRKINVEIVTPAGSTSEKIDVSEPSSAVDPDSAHAELGPGYVAYSASGTVTAPVVYVNYGLPPDYQELAGAGIEVKGRIVLARYGRSHRAVKIHTAQERGAAGIIIYSDPADDGAARGAVWPEGPWRADHQVQRGNGKYSWFWHGDPLTPGIAAVAGAAPLDPSRAPTLPRIPAVVLSSKEAAKIRAKLTGPGSVTVRLDVQMDAGPRTIRNVIARIPGRDRTRQVILGTHHDAWTFGGMDPGSGLSAVFEVARGLAALHRQGWRPERDLAFAFWDAEEFGLIGSTEYAEQFQRDLRERTVAYINTDLFMRGRFDGGGTPSLRDFLVQVAKDVPHFDGKGSVYDRWRADQWSRLSEERRRPPSLAATLPSFGAAGSDQFEVSLAALGSGADFVAFQDYLGLPTLQMEFDFEGSYGAYHSNYDTRWFVERHSDPGFAVARTLVQVLGLAMMRLGTAEVLPFRYSHYGALIGEFLDAAEGWGKGGNGRVVLPIDLGEAKSIASDIRRMAIDLESRISGRTAAGSWTTAEAKALNDRLVRLEQLLLDEREPPSKRWYRHVIYGWNIYALYDGQPLPGLADAARVGSADRVKEETARIVAALRRMRAALEAALATM